MAQAKKVLLIVLDGLGDRPIANLGGMTPLEAARTPNFSFLLDKGSCGLMDAIGRGVRPGSDTAHLSIFGYDPQTSYTGRGPLEAAGLGVQMKEGDLAFRTNLATVNSSGVVVDRRAGRIDNAKPLEAPLNSIKVSKDVSFTYKSGAQHRGVLVMHPGKVVKLSDKITEVDSHAVGTKIPPAEPENKSEEATLTAKLLNDYLSKAKSILAKHPLNKARAKNKLPVANALVVRGAGFTPALVPFKEKYGFKAVAISGPGVYKGITRLAGFETLDVKGATGRADTNLKEKVSLTLKSLEKNDFVFLHIKGTDVFGHDGDFYGKKNFIEAIDLAVAPLTTIPDTLVIVTADHSTPCDLKNHSGDPVPILFSGPGVRKDDIRKFAEKQCANGGLGRLTGRNLMPEIINVLGRAEIYGS